MIASPNFESRSGATVRLIVVHTAEGALTTAELGNFFANPASQVSSHVGIDDHGIEQYVDYTNASWTMLSANPISEHAELCGFASWTRDQWLGQHMPMLTLAAQWIRQRCAARGIPVVKLSPADVAAGKAGVCGHVDWTNGMHDGTHQDPGPPTSFPWDVVISLAQGAPAPSAVPPESEEDVVYIKCQPDPKGPVLTAIWSGPIFVGLGAGEVTSADAEIAKGARCQWVGKPTWDELDRRSHALCDNPRPVVVAATAK